MFIQLYHDGKLRLFNVKDVVVVGQDPKGKTRLYTNVNHGSFLVDESVEEVLSKITEAEAFERHLGELKHSPAQTL